MKPLSQLYHFLGSIYFAVPIVLASALFVAYGTFVEASSDSHTQASQVSYGHPLFALLLCAYFANILLSALRRWPFRRQHVPFLLTHLGLLLMLSGAIWKSFFGVQGNLALWEGTGNEAILLPSTEALAIEDRLGDRRQFTLRKSFWDPHPDFKSSEKGKDTALSIQLLDYHSNCQEQYSYWIKKGHLEVFGLPRIPAPLWKKAQPFVSVHTQQWNGGPSWQIYAYLCEDPEELLRDFYAQQGAAKAQCEAFDLESTGVTRFNLGTPQSIRPSLLFLRTVEGQEIITVIDSEGVVDCEVFDREHTPRLFMLEQGFQGYLASHALELPLETPIGRRARARAQLVEQMEEDLAKISSLPPPLALLREAATRTELAFPELFLSLLEEMAKSDNWLLHEDELVPGSLREGLDAIPWHEADPELLHACLWCLHLLPDIETRLSEGWKLEQLLKQRKWPWADEFAGLMDTQEALTLFTQQLFLLAGQLPPPPLLAEDHQKLGVRLMSAALRAYGYDYEGLLPDLPRKTQTVALEGVLESEFKACPPLVKLEDNRALLTVELQENGVKTVVQLPYERYAGGLKRPALNGRYLLRFQPETQSLPHHLRLRQARQLNYPGSQQAFAYEASLWITEAGKPAQEAELSMNHVYESDDGYRFYLANVHPEEEGAVKQVQIVVNHDPYKYRLTYPGAAFMALGIVLLFLQRTPLGMKARRGHALKP